MARTTQTGSNATKSASSDRSVSPIMSKLRTYALVRPTMSASSSRRRISQPRRLKRDVRRRSMMARVRSSRTPQSGRADSRTPSSDSRCGSASAVLPCALNRLCPDRSRRRSDSVESADQAMLPAASRQRSRAPFEAPYVLSAAVTSFPCLRRSTRRARGPAPSAVGSTGRRFRSRIPARALRLSTRIRAFVRDTPR